MKKQNKYFISYIYPSSTGFGFGNGDMVVDGLITRMDLMNFSRDLLEKEGRSVAILSFVKYEE